MEPVPRFTSRGGEEVEVGREKAGQHEERQERRLKEESLQVDWFQQ